MCGNTVEDNKFWGNLMKSDRFPGCAGSIGWEREVLFHGLRRSWSRPPVLVPAWMVVSAVGDSGAGQGNRHGFGTGFWRSGPSGCGLYCGTLACVVI